MKHMKENYFISFLILGINLIFYLFFALYDGAVICVDSPSYINMHLSREPFYPMFLALLRTFFSHQGDFYLTAAIWIQSLLAALAAWSLIHYLQKSLNLHLLTTMLLTSIPLATSLLCRFAARRASMYSNSILTEGIACSLFLLFFRYLLEYCMKQTRKSLIISSIISFILISTRKQMYLSLFLLILCIIYVSIISKKHLKGLLIIFICTCSILLGCNFLDNGFNYAVHKTFATHSSDNRFLATMVFYTSEPEDSNAIFNTDTKKLFDEIYEICDNNGYLKHSAGKGWYHRVNHFGDHYDCIQIDTMWPMIQQYVRDHYTGDSVFLEEQVDAITQEIINALLPQVWPKIITTFFDNFLSGLVTTVAQRNPLLIAYSIFIYIAYTALLIVNLRKYGLSNKTNIFAILILFSIILNLAIVSAVIFCQTRYTIYNMPLFYMCGILLLKETFVDHKLNNNPD